MNWGLIQSSGERFFSSPKHPVWFQSPLHPLFSRYQWFSPLVMLHYQRTNTSSTSPYDVEISVKDSHKHVHYQLIQMHQHKNSIHCVYDCPSHLFLYCSRHTMGKSQLKIPCMMLWDVLVQLCDILPILNKFIEKIL